MKICISTDFHLSYRQYGIEEREQDFYRQYEKLIDHIIEEKPSIFLILGDIFDTPYPKPISIKVFQEGLQRLERNNIKTYGITGNHTVIQRKGFVPIDTIFEEKYGLLDDDFIIEDGVFIGGLGYHPRTHDIKHSIDCLYESSKGCKLKVLLLHQILKKDNPLGYDFDEDDIGLNRFDYVFLGHLHKRKTRCEGDTIIHYPGSLNSCNVTELVDEMRYGKGYTVFDTDLLELHHIAMTSQREYIEYYLKDDDLNNRFLDETLKSLKGSDVKPIVLLKSLPDSLSDMYELRDKLENDCLTVKCKTIALSEDNDSHGLVMGNNDFSNENNVEDLIMRSFSEKWKGECAVGIFRAFCSGDVEGARSLVDDVFHKVYG